ncbi:type II secretion system protein GspG [Microbulbifer sp. 2201CG32-9]|uniref:type II secretion system protein GspG n=1 Tax=unclassified Microbulbifer TaxID=2619833 RepID=UPI00345B86E3
MQRLDRVSMRVLSQFINIYSEENGRLPSKVNWQKQLLRLEGLKGKDQAIFLDAWGREFEFSSGVDGPPSKLWAYGRDGKPGGEERDSDYYIGF